MSFFVVVGLIIFGVLGLVQRDIGFDLVDTVVDNDAISVSPVGIVVPINVNMTGYNNNFFNVDLHNTTILGKNQKYQGVLVSGNVELIHLSARQDKIHFNVEMTLVYSGALDKDTAFLKYISAQCSDNRNGSIALDFSAQGRYSMYLKSDDFMYNRAESIPCSTFMDMGI